MTGRVAAALALILVANSAFAQESQVESDLRSERDKLAAGCSGFSPKAIGGCVYSLTTESPLHVAIGSLAPQNGFVLGLAFNEPYTPGESWRISWNADGVASFGGSWRGGLYLKLVHTPPTSGVVVRQPGSAPSSGRIAPRQFAVVDIFAQTISLKTVGYFGPGQQSLESGRSVFGERQTLVGTSLAYPFDNLGPLTGLNIALLGGVTGRFIDIRSGHSDDVPSIEQLYDDSTAPGLTRQRAFVEFREGIRLKPSVFNGRLRMNYLVSAQQFRTSSVTRSSFNRWTIDLQHEIPIYRSVSSSGAREFNGPDACAQAAGSPACPPVQWSRNRQGSIGLRLLVSPSTTTDGNQVPFYFQPTLGGSDLDGVRRLASYQDYRFRGPNAFLLQESVEHSIWGPVGAFVMAEQGKVTLDRSDLNFKQLTTSTTVGLTIRAGGFPLMNFSFSWGAEGHHAIGSIDSTLLGGSTRPSLY